ncbi:hypothetical protein ABFZ85_03965 [Hyphococcus formosus]|uniref:hypothetical protein n=1 Tax=Hyphococcus formosus TaxID=3143534 RepID=UPI00398B2879
MRKNCAIASIFAFSGLLLISGCDQKREEIVEKPVPVVDVAVNFSDELPGLGGEATGLAFWDHPTLSFNGTLIVANDSGVTSYNMEDGNAVSRIGDHKAQGLAVGYAGFGSQAAGFVTFLDTDESAFRFYGIDNASRAFIPLETGPEIRGAVRGFCLGRAPSENAPTLFVIQKAKLQVFNLAAGSEGIRVANEATIDTPDDLVSCTVDVDGTAILASTSGAIYRLTDETAFDTPFAEGEIADAGDIIVLASTSGEDSAITGQLLLLDKSTGHLHAFDRNSGLALGVISFNDASNQPAIGNANVFNATSTNLGAIYRNGVAAFGIADSANEPLVRLVPGNSLMNGLSVAVGDPISPRGKLAETPEDGLKIPTNYQPE